MLRLGCLYAFNVLSHVSRERSLVLLNLGTVNRLDYGLIIDFLGIYVYYVVLFSLLLPLVFLGEHTRVVLLAQLIQMFLVFFCKVEIFRAISSYFFLLNILLLPIIQILCFCVRLRKFLLFFNI